MHTIYGATKEQKLFLLFLSRWRKEKGARFYFLVKSRSSVLQKGNMKIVLKVHWHNISDVEALSF